MFDLAISRQCLLVVDPHAFGGLEFGVVKVADAVFAHQAGRFLGDALTVAVQAILGVYAVMPTSGHGVHSVRPATA
ncbi:hypothetical protein GCM10027285_03640 [Oleiagrimonas citrea]